MPQLDPSPLADRDGDGFSLCGGDCDDASVGVHPGALEARDGVDNDCDGTVDGAGGRAGAHAPCRPSGSELNSTALPRVDRYDVVRGDLGALIAQAGQARGRDSLISAAPGACPKG